MDHTPIFGLVIIYVECVYARRVGDIDGAASISPELEFLNSFNSDEKEEGSVVKTLWPTYVGFLVTGVLLGSSPAQAADCTTGWNERAYHTGLITGDNIVAQAWVGIEEDCNRLEEFEAIVIDSLNDYALPAASSELTICRYEGHFKGMLRAIDDLYGFCAAQCSAEGELYGEIGAIAYCQLSFVTEGLVIPGDFLHLPLRYCDTMFQIACDRRYNTVTRAYVDDTMDDPETPDINEGMCIHYTDKGEIVDPESGKPLWEERWKEVRANHCAL